MEQKLRQLLAHILNCGTADTDFICNEFDNFDVEYSDIDEEYYKDANSLIGEIYYQAVIKCNIDEEKHKVSIFTNCLDSHLVIDGQEMYSITDLQNIKRKRGKHKVN